MKFIITSLLIFCLIGIQNSYAQNEMSIHRKGFVYGTSVGTTVSFINFPAKSQTDFDLALDIKAGYMLKPNLALLLTSNVSIYDYSGFGRDRKRDFGVLAPSVQYWFNNKIWGIAGVGLGGDSPVFYDTENPDTDPLERKYYNGFGFIISSGYEIYQRKNMAIDIKARLTYRNVIMQEGNTSGMSFGVLMGINFY